MRQMYTTLPQISLRPADAYQQMVRGEVESVPVSALAGRLSAVMLVPYPPGIPVIMPGERFPLDNSYIADYLAAAIELEEQFPGFANDIHGLRMEQFDGQVNWRVDCLIEG